MRFQLLFDINAQYFIFIQILPKINQKLLEMKNEVASDHGVNIIWNYAKKDYSWKESYFKHFSKTEKLLFFLPVSFLFLPIYGTYDLFYNHSWSLFVSLGLVMLFSIWWFHKQKAYMERQVVLRHYLSKDCSTVIDYHKQKLVESLGALNTQGNRSSWKTYFENKIAGQKHIAWIAACTGGFFYYSFISAPFIQEYLAIFYMLGIGLLALIMTAVFAIPAFTDLKFKTAIAYQAYNLILELEKDA